MFEQAVLLGNTERAIDLATTKGRRIKNLVEFDVPPAHSIKQYELMIRNQPWVERRPPIGRYNCAGHVWASRRTCILEPTELDAIIADDGYRTLRVGETPFPGDIAVYRDKDRAGEILHVGRVYEIRPGVSAGSPGIPWVISKWNSTSGESLHGAYDVPYRRDFNLGIEFITDRP